MTTISVALPVEIVEEIMDYVVSGRDIVDRALFRTLLACILTSRHSHMLRAGVCSRQ